MTPIPTTLEEAVDQIVSTMSAADKDAYAESNPHFPGQGGFFGGMAMRNDWGLWHGETGISRWLRERRVVHGDDQSLVILRAVWRWLHDLPIGDEWMAEQAAYYEAFWARSGLTWDMQPIHGFVPKSTRWLRCDETGHVEEVDDPSL